MFPSWWSERFGQTSPLGYRLRAAFPERWLRIHSLPQSKRYPGSAAELDVLLHRHRTVAAAVLSPATPCKLLTPRYEPAVVGSRSTLHGFGDRGFECIASLVDHEDYETPDDPQVTSYWVTEAPWDPEANRSLLVDIAEDRLRALWLDPASGEVYAPYDGGADLILSSPERRAHLRREFSAWLSARPDGL